MFSHLLVGRVGVSLRFRLGLDSNGDEALVGVVAAEVVSIDDAPRFDDGVQP